MTTHDAPLNTNVASEPIVPPGYSARPTTTDDAPAIATLINTAFQAAQEGEGMTADMLLHDWAESTFDQARNTRLITHDATGTVAAYAEVWDTHPVPVSPGVWVRVHPDHLGQGLGTALTTWGLNMAQGVLDRVPAHALVAAMTQFNAQHEPSRALLTELGWEPYRVTYTMATHLEAPPQPTPLPPGVTLRPFVPGQDDRLTAQGIHEAFQDHRGHVPIDEETRVQRLTEWYSTDPHFDPALWLIAIDDATGAPAGVSLSQHGSWSNASAGYVATLGTSRAWRRKGLGLALLTHAFAVLYAKGHHDVELHVDAYSLTGATRLYERGGMHVKTKLDQYRKILRPGIDISRNALDEETSA